ncbi:diglucosyl diacylglycerol synthase [Bacillus sp. FJAT-47783]|uniref:diglucosyl diacylglycerol synthase n=1 Tax=Bacillus sp. FJAT-47783 TaxID=2922712 RepID=UPI001FAC34D3|nr:diglucosyl diacylglycerol synthase [Bacillus sp. FJAT-47783]
MKSNPKILILTAKYGNGHIQVAKTLEQRCKQLGMNVVLSDLYQESHPVITEVTKYLYLKSFSVGKQFYRLFYYGVDKMYDKRVLNVYYKMGNKRLHEIITNENPDIIINTFPMIVVPEYRRRTGKVIPTFNVLTDFCLHKIWVHPDIDKYYVASHEVKEKLIDLGTHPMDIMVTGIPIREPFEKEIDTAPLFDKFGLHPNKKTLLIMAGAHGVLKNVKDLCESFLHHEELQTVVVCGKNQALHEQLAPIANEHPHKLKALGYVENIDELFRISSCMITKPGGITLSEAAAIGVPLILYKPVPGQEKENAEYFERNGAAKIVTKIDQIGDVVNQLLQNPELIAEMKQNIQKLHHGNAVDTILTDILQQSEQIKEKAHYVLNSANF